MYSVARLPPHAVGNSCPSSEETTAQSSGDGPNSVIYVNVNDGGVVLVDGDALRLAQVLEHHAFQRDAQFISNGLIAGQDGDVVEDPRRWQR